MVFSINTLFSNEQEITKHVIQVVIVKIHVNLRLCKIIQSGAARRGNTTCNAGKFELITPFPSLIRRHQ